MESSRDLPSSSERHSTIDLSAARNRSEPVRVSAVFGLTGRTYLGSPGRVICVAAGNAGQEAAESADDIGWIMGRIHTSGRIASRGLEQVLEWTVVENGVEDVSDNELETKAQGRLQVHFNQGASADLNL